VPDGVSTVKFGYGMINSTSVSQGFCLKGWISF